MSGSNPYVTLCSVGIALALASGAAAKDPDGSWVKDELTGCKVFSAEDVSEMKVAWSGDCVDGKADGTGVLVIIGPEGVAGVYEGDIVAGLLDGEGRLVVQNEETGGTDAYTGDFANGTLDGEGELVSSAGWSYTGDFKDGEEHGAGTIENDEGAVFKSNFENGKPVGTALVYYKTDAGEVYFGEAENKARNGQGHLIKANQDVYIGEFEDGVASGTGTYDSASGGVFVGDFARGNPNGFGTFTAPNGDVYQGRFVDGKATGKVLVSKKGGAQALETWVNGEKKQ